MTTMKSTKAIIITIQILLWKILHSPDRLIVFSSLPFSISSACEASVLIFCWWCFLLFWNSVPVSWGLCGGGLRHGGGGREGLQTGLHLLQEAERGRRLGHRGMVLQGQGRGGLRSSESTSHIRDIGFFFTSHPVSLFPKNALESAAVRSAEVTVRSPWNRFLSVILHRRPQGSKKNGDGRCWMSLAPLFEPWLPSVIQHLPKTFTSERNVRKTSFSNLGDPNPLFAS